MQKKWIWITLGVVVLIILAFIVSLISNIFGPGGRVDVLKMSNKEVSECLDDFDNGNGLPIPVGLEQRSKISFCPSSKSIYLKSGRDGAIAFRINNFLNSSNVSFSYEIVARNDTDYYCARSSAEILGLIKSGESESNIFIDSGGFYMGKVIFSSKDYPICRTRYIIRVYTDGVPYSNAVFDVMFN